jgi:hypothetical protein
MMNDVGKASREGLWFFFFFFLIKEKKKRDSQVRSLSRPT